MFRVKLLLNGLFSVHGDRSLLGAKILRSGLKEQLKD